MNALKTYKAQTHRTGKCGVFNYFLLWISLQRIIVRKPAGIECVCSALHKPHFTPFCKRLTIPEKQIGTKKK